MVWTKNRNGFIDSALRIAGVVSVGNQSLLYWTNEAADCLNAIITDLYNSGFVFLQTEWTTRTLIASSEVTGSDGNIYTCIRGHISTAATRPITGNNWRSFWVQKGTTGGIWASGATYTSIGDFNIEADTLEILRAYIREDNYDNPSLTPMNGFEYHSIDRKLDFGIPTYIYVDYQLIPHVYLIDQPDKTTYILNYWRVKKLSTMDLSSSITELDQSWYDYIIYRLADHVSDRNQALSLEKKQWIKLRADELEKKARKLDFHRNNDDGISYGCYDVRIKE